MNSMWLDGPKLVAWLRSTKVHLPNKGDYIGSRVREWERGARAKVWTVDRVLIDLGLHLSEVPDECYLPGPGPTGKVKRKDDKRIIPSPLPAVDVSHAFERGMPNRVVARKYGITEFQARRKRKEWESERNRTGTGDRGPADPGGVPVGEGAEQPLGA